MQFETHNYYQDDLPLEKLYSELGTVEYNLSAIKSSLEMLQQAKQELLKKISDTLQTPSKENNVLEANNL